MRFSIKSLRCRNFPHINIRRLKHLREKLCVAFNGIFLRLLCPCFSFAGNKQCLLELMRKISCSLINYPLKICEGYFLLFDTITLYQINHHNNNTVTRIDKKKNFFFLLREDRFVLYDKTSHYLHKFVSVFIHLETTGMEITN